jgi:hypothetical protein
MNIYDQLLEIHDQLIDDEMWLTLLETAFEELEIDNIDDLIELSIETQDEGIISNLISEGENILSFKDPDNYYDEGEYDNEY